LGACLDRNALKKEIFPLISDEYAKRLVEDRIEFKLFSAEYHLGKLRDIERSQGAVSASFRSRVHGT
jgi:hypothetical protein